MSGPEIDFHCPKHGTFCEQDHCTDCRYEKRIAELEAKVAELEGENLFIKLQGEDRLDEIKRLREDLNAALCRASEREQESGLLKCRQKIVFQLTLIAKLEAREKQLAGARLAHDHTKAKLQANIDLSIRALTDKSLGTAGRIWVALNTLRPAEISAEEREWLDRWADGERAKQKDNTA